MDRGIPWIDFTIRKGRTWDKVHFLQKQTASNREQRLFFVLKIQQISRAPGLHF
jgi:hypothetical protein